MQISERKCVAFGNCVPICPMGAIHIDPVRNRATVNADECVACYTGFRGMSFEHLNPWLVRAARGLLKLVRLRFEPEPDVCPTAAIEPDELSWPRVVRRAFSDPLVSHESTGVHGRGTEEVKTNDITGRVKEGEAGFTVEFGRPSIGVRFRDIERMTRALAAMGLSFEDRNPVTHMMTDRRTGKIRDDILDEKILSAIVELKTTLEDVPRVLDCIEEVATRMDTVVCVGVATRCDSEGKNALEAVLREEKYEFLHGKTNLGLGRPSASPKVSSQAVPVSG